MQDAVIGIVILLGFAAIAAIVSFQVYDFLAYGSWHWFTVAELLARAGYNPAATVDPNATWSWVGIGKAVNWAFYTAPAVLIALIVSIIIGWLGFSAVND